MDKTVANNAIYFYGSIGLYGYLSNFYKCNFQGIQLDNNNIITFNCVEQYFVYNKCILFNKDNTNLLNKILKETNPVKIKAYGRKVENFDNKIWDNNKCRIMCDGLYYKFSQNSNLQDLLLKTNNKILYEASPRDKVWGIGLSAQKAITKDVSTYGKNLLGKCLMNIRTRLINEVNTNN